MKVVAMPREFRRSVRRPAGSDEFLAVDYTSPPKRPRRLRRRPDEDVGNPSTIFPKAATVPAYVSDRNPYGTEYVEKLIQRIDSGLYPHELDARRKATDVEAEEEIEVCAMEEAS